MVDSGGRLPLAEFAKRVALAAGIALATAALAAFLWLVSHAVVVLFAAMLFAVLLDGLMRLLMRIHVPRRLALVLVILILAVGVAGIFVFGGLRVANEAPHLQQAMEQSVNHLQSRLEHTGISLPKLAHGGSAGGGQDLSKLFGQVNRYLSTSLEVVADLFIIIVVGIYFAASPRFYIETPVKLFSVPRRERLRTVFGEVGHALRRWLIGRFASMAAVGLVTGIGLALLGVPMAALLAIIACLMTFIPYLGTIISLVPAVLVALLITPMTSLYVVLLFLGAHALEGYLLSPLIQSRTVHLAPGWLILSQLVGGLAGGIFGILIAAPMLVTITIVVQLLYVQDVLGDRVHVLGK